MAKMIKNLKVLKVKKFTQPDGAKILLRQMESMNIADNLRFHCERIVNDNWIERLLYAPKSWTDRRMLDWEYFEKKIQLKAIKED